MIQWIDGCERQSWSTDGGSFLGGPPKGVLHTTETTGWPGYAGGKTAPHFTISPEMSSERLLVRQHTPLDRAARALRNESGGVQTNRDGAIQIELVGTCDAAYAQRFGGLYWPSAPEWALSSLGAFMRTLEEICGIARTAVAAWLEYPSSYGSRGGQRLTLSQWDNFSGWCGHQHVPENTHGDPGRIDIVRLLGEDRTVPVAKVTPVPVPAPVPVGQSQTPCPTFPLPRNHVFGPREGDVRYHSGYYGANDRNGLRAWQKQMRSRGWGISVDGLYGDQTRDVATRFQREKFGRTDGPRRFDGAVREYGLIGNRTWEAAWTAPRT